MSEDEMELLWRRFGTTIQYVSASWNNYSTTMAPLLQVLKPGRNIFG